ncbi:ComF family protein [Erythrobacter litoralis]|nr:ComF family protein [Erythrobacter litoralis]
MAREVRDGLAPVVDFIYPPRCPVCGDAVMDQNGLCSHCWSMLDTPGEPCCAACQIPLDAGDERTRCLACVSRPPVHEGIAAATLYSNISRQIVLSLKHGRRIALAAMMARLMATRLPQDDVALLVPVPLHRWRLWKRGFNQAALIARELSMLGKGELLVDGLVRYRQTPSLGGLSASQRREKLAGAIRAKQGAVDQIAGRNIVLVDDVLTSGATSGECVRVLKAAGAREVRIACFARVANEARSAA